MQCSIHELAGRLDKANTEDFYDLLSGIFIPYENNMRISSHMELFAEAIISVKETITKFLKTGDIPDYQSHIPGLNDYQAYSAFLLLITTQATPLFNAIEYSEEEVNALERILIQVAENQVAYMKSILEG